MPQPNRKKTENRLYVIRKYIYAPSAHDAILKDRKAPVDDVWVDDEWKKNQIDKVPAMGFLLPDED